MLLVGCGFSDKAKEVITPDIEGTIKFTEVKRLFGNADCYVMEDLTINDIMEKTSNKLFCDDINCCYISQQDSLCLVAECIPRRNIIDYNTELVKNKLGANAS